MELIGFLLIGLIAGWIATTFIRGSGMGLVGNLVIGVIGAFVGGFLFRLLGFSAVGLIGQNVVCLAAAPPEVDAASLAQWVAQADCP